MRGLIISLVFLFCLVSTIAFPFGIPRTAHSSVTLRRLRRQVGEGVNGNQTGNSGSVTGGGGGDGNGVGFAGTGNDIDTGDDFDIGDGNNTIGDNNTIEIGDRITTINVPLNMSDIMDRGMTMADRNGVDMSIDISVRMKIADAKGKNGTITLTKDGRKI
ncbi:hypothetical protein CC80DRAFT_508042 [Byssothecium circinans]|uniref:Uncharacterized protein n=1 Tax=Byssothecium circinans TaxID=147558 RepID=A0A6A5TP57_9PLEO|nr:hypothetical protein CC80DRAFT_508042 [Byssothecium circinans]